MLDESEALIGGGEPEGDDDEELVQRRLAACEVHPAHSHNFLSLLCSV